MTQISCQNDDLNQSVHPLADFLFCIFATELLGRSHCMSPGCNVGDIDNVGDSSVTPKPTPTPIQDHSLHSDAFDATTAGTANVNIKLCYPCYDGHTFAVESCVNIRQWSFKLFCKGSLQFFWPYLGFRPNQLEPHKMLNNLFK